MKTPMYNFVSITMPFEGIGPYAGTVMNIKSLWGKQNKQFMDETGHMPSGAVKHLSSGPLFILEPILAVSAVSNTWVN